MALSKSGCIGICADAGTVNCPCPLAETGDCLICSRLSGEDRCGCSWVGVCVYNEYIQNGRRITGRRENVCADRIRRISYGDDLYVLVLRMDKGFAMHAAAAGAFVFVGPSDRESFYNVPLSVMKADTETGEIYLVLKVISGKTKLIAEAGDKLLVRGVYRNGILGCISERNICSGTGALSEILHDGHNDPPERWLIVAKGVGFAPAVNILRNLADGVQVDLAVDLEKINEDIIRDFLEPEVSCRNGTTNLRYVNLAEDHLIAEYDADDYSRVVLLASDYYIDRLRDDLHIPEEKLLYSNNFSMCCGEGICGACCITDSTGVSHKMCKCRAARRER